ncbi:TRA1-like protein [Mya arenaria]|uniref:TRA1-like protein n=1 Tax=Mya arenaria TaxID=6604 RepID=A0ABY7DW27_MYAAR|nr:TRA1-like protein [Mya arenaria]
MLPEADVGLSMIAVSPETSGDGPQIDSCIPYRPARVTTVINRHMSALERQEDLSPFLKTSERTYPVPTRPTVRARVEKRYADERSNLISRLEKATSVSLTTDTWTSNSTESFITVTAHYLDAEWIRTS